MTSPRIADRFAFHRSTPQITVDEYERRRVIELGEWVAARGRIYLDKCFWIHLRAAAPFAFVFQIVWIDQFARIIGG